MKRALALTLILVLLGGAGLVLANRQVRSQEDQVVVTERILVGDPSLAEDITIYQQVEYDQHIRWDITYKLGEAPETSTVFTFSHDYLDYSGQFTFSGLSAGTTPVYEQGYSNLEAGEVTESYRSVKLERGENLPEELIGVNKAYHELYEETEAGEAGSKIIRLSDYYDYYPLQFMMEVPGFSTWWDWSEAFEYLDTQEGAPRDSRLAINEYFRIPVLEEETLEINIEKQASGQLWSTGYGSTESDSYQPWVLASYTDEAVYFIMNGRSSQGKVMDFSQVPGGYGIYRLPIPQNLTEEETHSPNMVPLGEVTTICSLDPEAVVTCLQVSDDQTRLYLVTIEDGVYYFTVMDLERYEILQKLELASCTNEEYYWNVQSSLYEKENVLILWLGYVDDTGDHFAVLIPQENGTFELEFLTEQAYVFDYAEDHGSFFVFSPETFAWNGEKLAVIERLSNQVHDQQTFCSCAVAIYDATGLVYYNVLDNSLGITSFDSYDCGGNYNTPLRVEWDAE